MQATKPKNATEALAERVAASLTRQDGLSWSMQTDDERHTTRIVCSDGAALTIIKAPKERIEISPQYGDCYKFTTRNHQGSITVSAERPAEQIAKEIKRRLLTQYRADLTAARAAKAQDERDEQRRAELLAELSAAYGTPSSWQDNTFYNRPGRIGFAAEVYSTGQINIHRLGSMTEATARKILAILADPTNK